MPAPSGTPPPIRIDTSNPFAHDTMTRRVPNTIHQILDVNPDYAPTIRDALSALRETIENDGSIPHLDVLAAPDAALWNPLVTAHKGEGWLSTAWFFAETYFYRQVMRCVRWWETERDPFTPIKHEEYASPRPWELLEAALDLRGMAPDERLRDLLHLALWANRIDLSFAASLARGTDIGDDDLLADDSEAIARQIVRGSGPVQLILDNAGTELTLDAALVDGLLDTGVETVILHVKVHPTFVSDATVHDVWDFLKRAESRGGDMAGMASRLRAAFDAGRLRIAPHFFWNSGYFLWDMPALDATFDGARLVIVKGDAKYRRLVGDAIWPADTPFADVMGYFPAPIAALRTLKSDPIVGLRRGEADQLDTIDADWRVNGQRGVMQYAQGK